MADLLYQATVRGAGFNGPGQEHPGQAIALARLKLRDEDGPFHEMGKPKHELRRADALDAMLKELQKAKPGQDPIVWLPKNYDQGNGVALRAIKAAPKEAEWVTYARKFDRCTPYLFQAIPHLPCGSAKSDCSGCAKECVFRTKHIDLPHGADLIMHDSRVSIFHDADAVVSGDFVFYHFPGRLLPGQANDITMVVGDHDPGMQIGARPSVKPGYTHDGVQIWRMDAPGEEPARLCFGRLKAA